MRLPTLISSTDLNSLTNLNILPYFSDFNATINGVLSFWFGWYPLGSAGCLRFVMSSLTISKFLFWHAVRRGESRSSSLGFGSTFSTSKRYCTFCASLVVTALHSCFYKLTNIIVLMFVHIKQWKTVPKMCVQWIRNAVRIVCLVLDLCTTCMLQSWFTWASLDLDATCLIKKKKVLLCSLMDKFKHASNIKVTIDNYLLTTILSAMPSISINDFIGIK